MYRLFIASLVAAAALFAACFDSPDPLYCDQDTPCTDPERPFCDLNGTYPASDGHGRTCIPDPGIVEPSCEASSECPAEAPICEEECRSCAADAECQARDPAAPYCGESGACVSCLSADDCSADAPVCGDTGQCRGCEAHSECASGVCEIESGTCAGASALVHVDAESGADGASCGSQSAPCASIAVALERVDANRSWVVLAAGTYAESVIIDGLEVTLLGPPEAVIQPGGGAVGVSVESGSAVTLEGLSVKSAISGAAGVLCFAGAGATPTLQVRDVQIAENSGAGIDADDCNLMVERSTLRGNSGGGLLASGGSITVEQSALSGNVGGGISIQNSSFRVVNNVIVGNGNSALPGGSAIGGVRLSGDPVDDQGVFEFNTVSGNVNATASAAGVDCADQTTPLAVANNIVFRNGSDDGDQVRGSCAWSYSLVQGNIEGIGNIGGDPQFVDAEGGNFHLQPSSPAVDAADPEATLEVDVDGDARPGGAALDIGADEVVP